jgi:hypothetical protein
MTLNGVEKGNVAEKYIYLQLKKACVVIPPFLVAAKSRA